MVGGGSLEDSGLCIALQAHARFHWAKKCSALGKLLIRERYNARGVSMYACYTKRYGRRETKTRKSDSPCMIMNKKTW